MTSYDPIDTHAQQEGREEAEARRRLMRKQETEDLKWLMNSRRGRRIMWRWLEISGPFRLSFDANALKMAFAEGNRNLGNQLFNEVMEICPEMYPVMVKEQHDDRDSGGPKPK